MESLIKSRVYSKYVLILFAFLACSCGPDNNEVDYADVSGIQTDSIDFVRFDRLVMSMDTQDIKEAYLQTVSSYPNFTDLYFKRLLSFPSADQDSFYGAVKNFVSAELIVALQDTIDHIYPSIQDIEDDFREAFRFLKFYLPEYPLPDIYFMQTEFGYQTILFSDQDKDGVGVGLDLFLGSDFDYKAVDPRNPAFSEYLSRSYNRDHIVRKTLAMLLEDQLRQPSGKRFLDLIIHNGKLLYSLRRMLPMCHDTVVSEFSSSQLAWLEDNELEIWSYFLEKELIYETNHLKIDKYVNQSPHSPGMPPEAPGRTGSYIGWRIVEAFMSENPEYTLMDLWVEPDAQKIMELAKYKPRRR